MTTLTQTPANEKKLSQLREVLTRALADALCRGFHGSVGIELSVQDGTIQHIRQRIERIER